VDGHLACSVNGTACWSGGGWASSAFNSYSMESIREGFGYPEARTSVQVFSPGPELPPFSDRAASVMGTQTGHVVGQCAHPALQVDSRGEDEHHMEGGRSSVSGSRDGWEYVASLHLCMCSWQLVLPLICICQTIQVAMDIHWLSVGLVAEVLHHRMVHL